MKDKVTNVLRLASLVRENVRTKQLFTPYNTILVTLSGGQDSISSLFFLYLLQDQLGLTRAVVCRHAETKVGPYRPTPRSHSAQVRSVRVENMTNPSATATKWLLSCRDVVSSQMVQPRRVKKYLSRTAGARRRAVARRLIFVRGLRSGSIDRDGGLTRRVWLLFTEGEQPACAKPSVWPAPAAGAGRRRGRQRRAAGAVACRTSAHSCYALTRPTDECVRVLNEAEQRNVPRQQPVPRSSTGRDKTLLDWLPCSCSASLSKKLPEQTAPAARLWRPRRRPAPAAGAGQIEDLAQAGSAARLRRARPHSFYGRLSAQQVCSPKVSTSRGLSTRFHKSSRRIDQFGLLWCNHFWQKESFYTMLHIAKLNLCFSSQMCFFLPIDSVLCEENARDWRHKSIQRTCAFFHYECCTQGHTKSDRVETILFNLLRGTGITGLQMLQWKKSFYSFSCQRFYPHLSFSKLKWARVSTALSKRTQELHKIEDSSKFCLVNLCTEPVFKLPTRSFYRPCQRVGSSITAVGQQEQ